MRYFLMKEDKDYHHAPRIQKWYGELDTREISQGNYASIERRMILEIKPDKAMFFPDVLFHPIFLVSSKIQECLELFEPNMQFKEVILLDKENRQTEVYYFPQLQLLDCLAEGSVYNERNGWLLEAEVDIERTNDKCLFMLSGMEYRYFMGRIDFVESILRRRATGFLLEETRSSEEKKVSPDEEEISPYW